jgi:hypothetical protein
MMRRLALACAVVVLLSGLAHAQEKPKYEQQVCPANIYYFTVVTAADGLKHDIEFQCIEAGEKLGQRAGAECEEWQTWYSTALGNDGKPLILRLDPAVGAPCYLRR